MKTIHVWSRGVAKIVSVSEPSLADDWDGEEPAGETRPGNPAHLSKAGFRQHLRRSRRPNRLQIESWFLVTSAKSFCSLYGWPLKRRHSMCNITFQNTGHWFLIAFAYRTQIVMAFSNDPSSSPGLVVHNPRGNSDKSSIPRLEERPLSVRRQKHEFGKYFVQWPNSWPLASHVGFTNAQLTIAKPIQIGVIGVEDQILSRENSRFV